MALPRSWSYPSADVSTTITNDVVTQVPNSSTDPGFNLAADSIQVPTIITAPPASTTLANTYGGHTASVATIVQNTLGYDVQAVAYFTGSASVASFLVGVSSTTPPAQTTVASSITSINNTWDFPVYLPNNYYFSFQATQANGAASVPSSSLVIAAYPV